MNKEYIGKSVYIKIDRPLGFRHPKYEYSYPINYGFVPDTVSGDGEEIDCYLLGVNEPIEEYRGDVLQLFIELMIMMINL